MTRFSFYTGNETRIWRSWLLRNGPWGRFKYSKLFQRQDLAETDINHSKLEHERRLDIKSSSNLLNRLMLRADKGSRTILIWRFAYKGIITFIRKEIDEEMSIRALSTTLLQVVYKIILLSKVVVKSIIIADDNSRKTLIKH